MTSLAKLACAATFLCVASTAQSGVAIDGGLTWTGWSSVGMSNQLGVYGSGTTTDVYEVYATRFVFEGGVVTGGAIGGGPTGGATGFGTGAFSAGAFANGNQVLGLGVRRVSGAALNFTNTVRFDLDNDSFQAASTVGAADGRTGFNAWTEFRDFSVQFEGTAGWRAGTLTMQAGNGTSYGGPNNPQAIVGGFGSGVSYDWPFRAFAQPNSYQMFFDLTAMQALYGGANPFGQNAGFVGIGAVGSAARIALNGLGSNNVVFAVPSANHTPYGSSCATPAFSLAASPPPISTTTAGTTVLYALGNVPLACPAPAPVFHFGVMVFSLSQDLAGTDLTSYGIEAPGCKLHVASIDHSMAYIGTTPNQTLAFDVPAGVPGGVLYYAQAAALICPVAPNNAGILMSNAVRSFINSF